MAGPKKEATGFINLGVVFNEQGEVLLIRRVKEEKGKDGSVLRWAFPGGKQRLDESREECICREILAETGYNIKPIQQISIRRHPQFPTIVVYHQCELNSPTPTATPCQPYEIAEIKWVKPEEAEKLITTDLDPDVRKVLGLKRA